MKRKLTILLLTAITAIVAHAAVRVNLHLGARHPIRRPGKTVVVRAAPRVVVRPNVTYMKPVTWKKTTVVMPARERLVWRETETIRRNEQWVDSKLSVNARGASLLLRIKGRAQLDFAEVHFDNGEVQVVDLHEKLLDDGVYPLLDFKNGRKVDFVRVVARSRTPQTRLTVCMAA